ncbi:hypothetical protein BDQ17DRAFT_1266103, partial [Cyathus striatus]
FIAKMAQYSPEEIGFIDETSKDEHTSSKGNEQRRANLLFMALCSLDGVVACTVVESSMTKLMFLDWLEHDVLPKCTVYPGPLSVIIMDNAKIHHGNEILELFDHFGK